MTLHEDVFTTVAAFEENTTGSFPSKFTTYTFRVSKSLKGKNAEEVSVTSWGTNCDSSFGPGTFYLDATSFEGKQ